MAIKRSTPNNVIIYPLKVEKWQADIIDQRLPTGELLCCEKLSFQKKMK